METIKERIQVKDIGETIDYTFINDISKNSIGVVKNVHKADVKKLIK